jgi:hypothetical protein
MSEGSNDLIGRYVYKVGQHLAAERREDVTRELLSSINDRVDDEQSPGETREDTALRVLREMGPPATVAANYGYEPGLLIGARSQPAFFKLVKILPAIMAMLFALRFLLSLTVVPEDWAAAFSAENLGRWLLEYAEAVLLNLGGLVVTFIVLERLSKGRRHTAATFDPARLPPVPNEQGFQKVSPRPIVVKIYALAALITLINLRPDWMVPMWSGLGPHRSQFIPIWALGIHVPVLLLSLWLAGHIVLKTELLREGHWTRNTRWAQVGLHAFGVVVLGCILLLSRFGQVNQDFLASIRISPADPMAAGFSQLSRLILFGLLWGILVQLTHFGKGLWRMSHNH